jgi:hypothetical protein
VTYIADILQYQLWDDWGLRPISYSGLTAVGKTNALMDRSSMISEIVAGDSAWECGDQLKTKNMAFTRSRSGDREYGVFESAVLQKSNRAEMEQTSLESAS